MEIGTMNRLETTIAVDGAAILLEQVMEALSTMGATFSMISRVENLVRMLDDLRVDINQCDLLNEGE
jgi:hypothetical protein